MPDDQQPRRITVVLFEGFELLDVFGPLERFGLLPTSFTISLTAPAAGRSGAVRARRRGRRRASRRTVHRHRAGARRRRHEAPRRAPEFLAGLCLWAANATLVSGVAAGMDTALAMIARLHGVDVAAGVADAELEWHDKPTWDPFAAKNGLVG